jgi:hypothetical protein
LGLAGLHQEIDGGRLELLGDRQVARRMEEWLGLSVFAREPRRVASRRYRLRTARAITNTRGSGAIFLDRPAIREEAGEELGVVIL